MKKLILYSGLALLIFSACSKKDDDYVPPAPIDSPINLPSDTTVMVTYSDTVDLSALPPISIPIAVDTSFYQNIATNYQAYLNQYNTTADKIVSVELKKLTMKMVSSSGQDFDFVDSLSIYVNKSGLPEKLVAYKIPFPKNQQTVDLDIKAGQNLKSYFLQDSLNLRIHGSLNATPASGIIITTPTFEIKANL